MDALISYFSDLEKRPLERAGFFIVGMVLLWLVENAVPLVHTHYKKSKSKHASTNVAFTAIHFIIHTLLAGGIIFIAGWTEKNNFGLNIVSKHINNQLGRCNLKITLPSFFLIQNN